MYPLWRNPGSDFLQPYSFHQVMRSLFIPLQLATDARGLEFITNLDSNIDKVETSMCSGD